MNRIPLLALALLTPPPSPAPAPAPCCRVLELRQYTLHPGQRDVLISLFEREFVESQEAQGMHLVGQFRDALDADRFVWLRGFSGMDARRDALAAFYGGPVWKAHREAANATMVDSSNVLLLRPVDAGFAPPRAPRPPPGAPEQPGAGAVVVATLYPRRAAGDALARFYAREVLPLRRALGAQALALFETEPAQNTFPALPVREGEPLLVAFERFESREAYRAHRERLAREPRWRERVEPALRRQLGGAVQVLLLEPTARSLLR